MPVTHQHPESRPWSKCAGSTHLCTQRDPNRKAHTPSDLSVYSWWQPSAQISFISACTSQIDVRFPHTIFLLYVSKRHVHIKAHKALSSALGVSDCCICEKVSVCLSVCVWERIILHIFVFVSMLSICVYLCVDVYITSDMQVWVSVCVNLCICVCLYLCVTVCVSVCL